MSTAQNNAGCGKIVLIVVGVGLGLLVLKYLYLASCYLAVNLFIGLDSSAYSRLGSGGWPSYALLGLGLGAAGGAVAAQRRFRLNNLVSLGAGALVLVLSSFVFIGNTATSATALDLASTDEKSPTLPDSASTTDAADVDEATVETVADTITQPADGFLMSPGKVAVWDSWTDSLRSANAYLQSADTVRLVRRVGGWVRVVNGGSEQRGDFPTGWVRLARLAPLPDQEDSESAPERSVQAIASNKPLRSPSVRDSSESSPDRAASKPASPTVAWPTGHQQHSGQVGKLAVTYSIDWQPNGLLSGSYYYDQKPGAIYRLTGSATATGELHLMEFTRGRQSARCELQLQNGTYVGTMFNTDGREFTMSLE